MSNFIYYEKLEDYEKQVEKAKLCDEKDKEIERLNENNQSMQEEMARTWKKLDEKENIIKEVREIFKYYGNKEDIVNYANYTITGESLLELLEILDKVDKEKE